jgi:hypothetical protein
MPKISEPEYADLKAFFITWKQEFPPTSSLPAEHHPVAVLNAMEQQSRAQARLGLGMAINDILEESWGFSPARVAEIDAKFRTKNILQRSELRQRYSRQFRGILKRGRIRNDTEYYLVQGILASFTTGASENERRLLEDFSASYGARTSDNSA